MDLTTLSLTQLFTRQAELNARHEDFVRSRNACPPGSFDWDLHNAACTGTMQDLADVAAEITRRIEDMRAGTEPAPMVHVPMACTACGTPVMQYAEGRWMHKTDAASRACTRGTGPVRARVDA